MPDLNYTPSPRALYVLKHLRIMDDAFMNVVFNGNYEAVELVLNIILERNDLKVLRLETQKSEPSSVPGGKSIRFDIYAEDADGKVYDIEIQRAESGADFLRARYYSGVIDSRMLSSGEDFSKLNESYVIFITETDVIGLGLPMVHIERTIRETGSPVRDGNHIIYVNGANADLSTDIGKLMHDFRSSSADGMYFEPLSKAVRHFKESEGGEHKMCKELEDWMRDEKAEGRAEGKIEGIAEGRAEGKIEGIAEGKAEGLTDAVRSLIDKLKIDKSEAMEMLNVPDELRNVILAALS